MPEGPSILILKEALQPFKGKKILKASGYADIDMETIIGKTITDIKTWGKHTLICFPKITLQIHLMMLGDYFINEATKRNPKLLLTFTNGTVSFHVCDVHLLTDDLDGLYDWSGDIMNTHWDTAKAKKKLKEQRETYICDALLDQHIFAGIGNIIKTEALFMAKVHPESKVGNIPARKMTELITKAKDYSFDFLKWKKADELKKHWLAYAKKTCPRCEIPLQKKYTGKTKRRSFFCENCQEKY